MMISPWGVFKALLCENYLESIKIAALLLSCCPGESWEVPVTQVEVTITYSSEKTAPALEREASLPANGMEGAHLTLEGMSLRKGDTIVYHCTLALLLKTPVMPLLKGLSKWAAVVPGL